MEFRPLHGGQLRALSARFGIPVSELLDFSANINPDGPPHAVQAALREAFADPSVLMDYPDFEEVELRKSLARYAGVHAEHVVVSNGFVPLLDAALRVLPVRRCLVSMPAFVEYRRTLERAGVAVMPHRGRSDENFRIDPGALFGRKCDSMLLANPQNPSGVLLSREALLQIVEEAARRNIVVFLDEAFIDYAPEATLSGEVERFSHLIVFRSVTKFFGMAGLRVAYALASREVSSRMQEAIAPWSITTLASLAAACAVQDEAYVQRTLARNAERRQRLQRRLEELRILFYPAAANFLLLRLHGSVDASAFWERMICEHRMVLRNCANYEALPPGHLRVAVRADAENERLLKALTGEMANFL
ncbi:pyridoxal phosphate-dependent aminotransferase [Silvibacterium dinghuense]|uniref:Aminotransferase n=1 Tax=Silvibacterium dinghuense TaxID=1560006 RepID=A0A4V1NVZ8_9BACT|nr:aminotransferase class I/II-fold pyridoxal phosphate-dependent enzyme [Silvibacterium dinghuense]RXS97672.1 pyridoxal phosphate-dependent class II aminotransferase [Silvibacterium dinghuense]GGH01009.1 threonine-phosphate decarboxylase [Silvibacterium dinghuense]